MPFMRYVQARAEEQRRERAYRFYVTEGIRGLCNFSESYIDLIDTKAAKAETRTPEEIIKGVKDHVAEIASR